MRSQAGAIRQLLLALVVSVLPAAPLSLVWWRASTYGGWPGSPDLLRRFILADGEAAHDLDNLGFFLFSLAALLPLVLWLLKRASPQVLRRTFFVGAVLFLAPALLLAAEALYVGLLASPAAIAEYRFGSEPMVQHGGWAYQSRAAYLARGLLWGGGLGAIVAFLASAARRAGPSAAV